MDFRPFDKIARLSRTVVVSEKIDGTNGVIGIGEDKEFCVGSRNKWITPQNDNYGFAKFAFDNKDALISVLGTGFHYGEWWGQGIQRNYGLKEKRFSLFNTSRWGNGVLPEDFCCGVVPVLYTGDFDSVRIDLCLKELEKNGSFAAPGFMNPEGIVIYHTAANLYFKKTIKNDNTPKGLQIKEI